MSEATFDEDDGGFAFTDEDFERRYYSQENNSTSGAGGISGKINLQGVRSTAQARRSPNRFMRTLLRRRLAAAARVE
jgi:hypothetical protein